jgi:perosamine synthetase
MSGAIPLSTPHLHGKELAYLTKCIETGWVSTAGAYVDQFESGIATYVGAKHAVALNSGTAALHMALCLLGIGPGDEVLVPTLTFIAPVNAIHYVGARPVFMDCDDHLNMDAGKVLRFCEHECSFEAGVLRNRRTGAVVRAIVPVHVFGSPVRMEPIMEAAARYSLAVVEDASESLGSRYVSGPLAGQATGTVGVIGCYSFNGNKIMTTGGGGMLVTHDAVLAERARYLSTQAKDDGVYYVHDSVGYNYRMTNLQAAVGVAQLEQLDSFIQAKRRNFKLYEEILGALRPGGFRFIQEPPYGFSNHWFYSLVLEGGAPQRDALIKELGTRRVQTRPIWKPNHLQAPYAACEAYEISNTLRWHDRVLNVPCSIGLEEADIQQVCEAIHACA